MITRRYHGLLIAALPAPLGRIVMLSHVAEQVRLADGRQRRDRRPRAIGRRARCARHRLSDRVPARGGLPVWRYDVEGLVIEKRLFLPHMQNTVHVMYELLSGADRVELALRPSVNFRAQEAPVSEPLGWPYEFRAVERPLRDLPARAARCRRCACSCAATDATFTLKSKRIDNVLYPVEESRGYQARGDLWSPGYFTSDAARRAAARRWSRRPSRSRR